MGTRFGAIDIYDSFSFVDLPAQHLNQVLDRMNGVTIRSQDARIWVATPKDQAPGRQKERFKLRDKRTFPKHHTQ